MNPWTAILGAVLALGAATTHAALVPPPGYAAPVQGSDDGGDPAQCPSPPKPFTGKLAFPSKYEGSDKARDDLNPKAEKKYEAMTADIRLMEKEFSALVSRYMHNGDRATLLCAVSWLDTWAGAGALRGATEDHTGKSVRKWALASLASAYLRLKFSESRPLALVPDKAKRIEAWFAQLADQVVADWRDVPLEKMNNHEYWAGWAVMAAAVVLDRRDLFDWALGQYRTAMGQIDAEGFLPNELKRDTRALSYHNYSLGPLAMIAAFAKANGVNLGPQGAAIQRLAGRVLAGVDDPKIFEKRTGDKQELSEVRENSKFAWMEAYCWTFGCDSSQQQRVARMRPLKTYRLGGNVTELFAAAEVRKSKNPKESEESKADARVARAAR